MDVSADRVRALLARWIRLPTSDVVTIKQLLATFTLAGLPREPIVMTPADDAWLRG